MSSLVSKQLIKTSWAHVIVASRSCHNVDPVLVRSSCIATSSHLLDPGRRRNGSFTTWPLQVQVVPEKLRRASRNGISGPITPLHLAMTLSLQASYRQLNAQRRHYTLSTRSSRSFQQAPLLARNNCCSVSRAYKDFMLRGIVLTSLWLRMWLVRGVDRFRQHAVFKPSVDKIRFICSTAHHRRKISDSWRTPAILLVSL